VTSRDGAMQLPNIVDYIADWARDVYRDNILLCLRGEEPGTPTLFRADSRIMSNSVASQFAATVMRVSTHSDISRWLASDAGSGNASPVRRNEEDHQISVIPHDGNNWYSSPFLRVYEYIEREHGLQSIYSLATIREIPPQNCYFDGLQNVKKEEHSFLKFFELEDGLKCASDGLTIRHCHLELFCFRHFPLPEDPSELTLFLHALVTSTENEATEERVQKLISELYQMFTEQAAFATQSITELEYFWTREVSMQFHGENYVRAKLLFQAILDPRSWLVVKEIVCISASERAIDQLLDVLDKPPGSAKLETFTSSSTVVKATVVLRQLSGIELLINALVNDRRHLAHIIQPEDHDATSFEWVYDLDSGSSWICDLILDLNPAKALFITPRQIQFSKNLEARACSSSLMPSQSESFLNQLPDSIKDVGALMLKDALTSSRCMFVFDQTSLDDNDQLVQKIIQIMTAETLYMVHRYVGPEFLHLREMETKIEESDARELESWATALSTSV
jgi:hypothetical protein